MRTLTEIVEEISRYMDQQKATIEGKLPAELSAEYAIRQRHIEALLQQIGGEPVDLRVSGSGWTH